jgi:endonuclease-3
VLDHVLYACCLENGRHEQVDEIFAKLEQYYFDWNEIRVTTITELAEVMSSLPDAAEAAKRVKQVLQTVFETHYSFDIEVFRKQNLGKSLKEIEKFRGVTPFTLAYVTQNALGGHSIPLNQGLLAVFVFLGVIGESDAGRQRVPGLERIIPKSKGVECASLLHQLGVDFATNPLSARLRSILLEIDPDAKDRLPKRSARKEEPEKAEDSTKVSRQAPASAPGKPPEQAPEKRKTKSSKPAAEGEVEDVPADESDLESTAPSALPTKRLSRKKPR